MITTEDEKITILELAFGMRGQLLDGSKSDRETVYNANIVIGTQKYWWGDFRKHWRHKLSMVASLLNEKVYLLREMDARFETEGKPKLEKAVFAYSEDGREIATEAKT